MISRNLFRLISDLFFPYYLVVSILFLYSVFNEQVLSVFQPVGLDARVMLRRTAVLSASRNALSRIHTSRLAPLGRSGWTRTIDLALIRRAL